MEHEQEIDIPGIIALLSERYKRTFFVKGKQRKPLKVGIYYDLVADLNGAIGEKDLSLVLHFYTNELSYLKGTRLGKPRIDLAGKAAGRVTEEQEVHAKKRFALVSRDKIVKSSGGSR